MENEQTITFREGGQMIRNRRSRTRHRIRKRFTIKFYLPLWMKDKVEEFKCILEQGIIPRGINKHNTWYDILRLDCFAKMITGDDVAREKYRKEMFKEDKDV
jgi:hypothetical protein